ncbi:uncharacterized protein CDAR_496621 [Caerostris darwini]|uniref:Uncharacterized protein n=1 Tax=Caerostris darwini TaxID=1538125 RepID=A0AAV4QD08_9ARAC|nr:uncharacterized protein CDAR_496621 [Caerostris darwini]
MNAPDLESKEFYPSSPPHKFRVYRGGQLAPMQWTSGIQANFTSGQSTPWLPLNPNYITRNVAANDDQLQLFKKLAELKRSRGTLPSEPTAAGSTFTDNGKLRYNSHIKERPVEFEWYQNPCGLIATRTTPKDVFFLANFGNESLGFVGDTRCEIGGKMIKFEYTMCKKIKIYLSTNLSLQDSDELEDLYLDPGDAIIGEKLNTWGY